MADVGAVVRGVVAAALRDVLGGPDASPGGADARAVAALLSRAQHVIVMAGAGLSTAAGIPDFRTPGTGLYYQLEKYALPDPQAVFDIGYFRQRPEPFHMLAREMWPGKFAPTDAHAFIRLLSDQGRLLRCYTQNIDGLERLAGVPAEKLVECHGTFASARAIDPPKAEVDIGWYRAQLDGGSTQIRCPDTDSLIKPDIVFFGEPLPAHFMPSVQADFPRCDLLVVVGTSLTVNPFARLVRYVGPDVPRVLVNLVAAGGGSFDFAEMEPGKRRDYALLGDLQLTIRGLAGLAGWGEELSALTRAQREAVRAARVGGGKAEGEGGAAAGALAESLAGRMQQLGIA